MAERSRLLTNLTRLEGRSTLLPVTGLAEGLSRLPLPVCNAYASEAR